MKVALRVLNEQKPGGTPKAERSAHAFNAAVAARCSQIINQNRISSGFEMLFSSPNATRIRSRRQLFLDLIRVALGDEFAVLTPKTRAHHEPTVSILP